MRRRRYPGYGNDTLTEFDAGSAYLYLLKVAPFNRLRAEVLADGAVRLTYVGRAGLNYALDRTFNLTPPVLWEPQATNPLPPAGLLLLTNTPVATTNSFWRFRSVP